MHLQGGNGVGVQCEALTLFLSNSLRARERKRDAEGCSGPRTPAGLLPPQLPPEGQLSPFHPTAGGRSPSPSPTTCRQTTLLRVLPAASLNSHLWLPAASGTHLGLLGMALPSGFHLSCFFLFPVPTRQPPLSTQRGLVVAHGTFHFLPVLYCLPFNAHLPELVCHFGTRPPPPKASGHSRVSSPALEFEGLGSSLRCTIP